MNNSTISLQTPQERVGLPLIVTSSKPTLCFLINTGSTHNIIFSYVYETNQNLFLFTTTSHKIMGIDGRGKKVNQASAELEFNGRQSKTAFSIVAATDAICQIQSETGVQIHGILGIPFLVENK